MRMQLVPQLEQREMLVEVERLHVQLRRDLDPGRPAQSVLANDALTLGHVRVGRRFDGRPQVHQLEPLVEAELDPVPGQSEPHRLLHVAPVVRRGDADYVVPRGLDTLPTRYRPVSGAGPYTRPLGSPCAL